MNDRHKHQKVDFRAIVDLFFFLGFSSFLPKFGGEDPRACRAWMIFVRASRCGCVCRGDSSSDCSFAIVSRNTVFIIIINRNEWGNTYEIIEQKTYSTFTVKRETRVLNTKGKYNNQQRKS